MEREKNYHITDQSQKNTHWKAASRRLRAKTPWLQESGSAPSDTENHGAVAFVSPRPLTNISCTESRHLAREGCGVYHLKDVRNLNSMGFPSEWETPANQNPTLASEFLLPLNNGFSSLRSTQTPAGRAPPQDPDRIMTLLEGYPQSHNCKSKNRLRYLGGAGMIKKSNLK